MDHAERDRLRGLARRAARQLQARHDLAEAMSDISQACYYAGWMSGLEHELWRMVSDPSADRSYGLGEISAEEIDKLRDLSATAGGWIVFCAGAKSRRRFVTFKQWAAIRAKAQEGES